MTVLICAGARGGGGGNALYSTTNSVPRSGHTRKTVTEITSSKHAEGSQESPPMSQKTGSDGA